MNKIQLLEYLTKQAKRYRADRDSICRNSDMLLISGPLEQDVIDSVLTDFINAVGMHQGIDYALYASDLSKP